MRAGDTRLLRVLASNRFYRDAGELLLVGLAFLAYFLVRANVVDRPDIALENARDIVSLERSLGIFVEPEWQRAILDNVSLVRFFNFVYFWLDFPLIAAMGLLMYFTRRRQYTFTRDAVLFSGLMALICYALFPVAPPRLLPEIGVIDTLQQFNNLSYQAQSTSTFVNPFAAMPSLHVGWSFLITIGVIWAWRHNPLVWLLAIAHPVTQSASTVFTGNHYFLDWAGGLTVAGLGLVYAVAMQRWGYHWLAARLKGDNSD